MELIKWQNVIIDWVNCLNLSKPVQSIRDLKNEDFFRKLLILITPNPNTSVDRSVQEISLTEFLKKHYPAYCLEDEPTLIQDDTEICNICSLLLHYCCVVDGRQEFTVPLCQKLNTTFQFHIKSFLEDLNEAKEINRDLLNWIITNNKFPESPTKQIKNSPLNSPKITGNASLFEYLKTPMKKQQVFDSHKREIKHLVAQLDLEKFEKADLQEELNLQYEKNKKLERTNSNKQAEISRLRSEIFSLESRSPPLNTKTDGRLENKRLRDEVISLERYIAILHKEQEELQTERDKARDKLRKIEESCNEWQNRAMNSERQCSKISEENNYQRNELVLLREKCDELSSILKELNAKNICDESYEIDCVQPDFIHNKSGPIDYESLAHTVIEVQLIDAQEENQNLRKQLSELEVNTTEVTSQMSQLQSEITKIMNENRVLLDENNNLKRKILDTETLYDESKQTLLVLTKRYEECRQILKQTEDDNASLNTSIVVLRNKLSETELNLTHSKNENDTLANDFKNANTSNIKLDKQLKQKTKDLELLMTENNSLQSHLNETGDKVYEFELENELLKEFIDKFNKVLETSLAKFISELKEYGELCDSDNIAKLQNMVTIIEKKIKNDNKKFKILHENCNSLTTTITSLQLEVATFYNKESESEKEKSNLKTCLEDAKSKIQQLEEDINNNNRIIMICKSTIEEKTSEISSLKDVIIVKDTFIKDLNKEKNNLSSSLEETEQKLSEEKRAKEHADKKICKLKNSVQEFETNIHHYEEELQNNMKIITSYKSIVEEKLSEISSLKNVIVTKDKFVEDLNREKCDLSISLKTAENELSEEKRLKETANDRISSLNISLQDAGSKIQELESNICEKSNQICGFKDTVASKENIIEELNIEKNNLTSYLELAQNKLSEEIQAKEVAENEINNLKTSLENVEIKIQELKVETSENNKLIETYKTIIEEKTNELNEIITNKDKLIENLSKEKCNLDTDLKSLEINLLELKKSKEITENNCQKLKNDLIDRENFIKTLETKKSDLENKVKYFNKEIATEKKTKSELKEKYKDLQNIIKQVENQMRELENDKTKLNNQLENVRAEFESVNQTRNKFEEDNSRLKKHISEKDIHLKNLEKRKEKLNTKLEKLEEELQKGEDSQNLLKIKLEEILKSLEEKSQIILDFEKERTNLQKLISTLEHELLEKTKQKEAIEVQVTEFAKSLAEKELCVKELELELNNIKNHIETLNNNLTSQELETSNKITEQIQKNQDLQNENNAFNQNFNMIQIEVSTIVNMLKTEEDIQINIDLEQIQNDGDTFSELSNTISNLKNNICSLIFEKRRLDNETTNLQQQITVLENVKSAVEDDYSKHKKDSNKKISELTVQLESSKKSNEHHKLNLATNRENLADAENKLKEVEKYSKQMMSDHVNEIETYKVDLQLLSEDINDLKGEIQDHKLQENNMTSDLLAVKNELKETIISYQQSLEFQEQMKDEYEKLQSENQALKENISSLSEDKNILVKKLDEITEERITLKSSLQEYSSKHDLIEQKIEDAKNNLDSNERIVQELQEKIKEKDNLISLQEQKINEINSKFTELIQEVAILNDDKKKLISQLSNLNSTLKNLEEIRQEITKDVVKHVVCTQETMSKMKADFSNKIDCFDKEHLLEVEIKKQLENLLQAEQNKSESLNKKLCEISSNNNSLFTLCKESHNKMHSIYTIVFENKEDTELFKQIHKFKADDKQLKSLFEENEIVSKEYDFITNEVSILKNTFKELSNYETLKSEYRSLKDKYNQLLVCESENNILKTKISEIANKLSDLQLENAKYQKEISEKEIDNKTSRGRYEEEINIMKITCLNWQKIIKENETEHKKLQNEHENFKQKYDTDLKLLQNSKCSLEETVLELQQKVKHHNNLITDHETKYQELYKKYETAREKILTLDAEILSLQDKINSYLKIIIEHETDHLHQTNKLTELTEQNKIFSEKCLQEQERSEELAKLRTSYSHVMSDNSQLQLDCTVLQKTIEDKNNQLSNLILVKESYEKILEENNKVNMELDTLRYKRTRDKEEFKRIIDEGNAKCDQQIQEVKKEYEEKLKKMKDKIVKLYREEVEKEKLKVCTLQQGQAEETIASLKSQVWITGNKYVDLKKEHEKLKEKLSKITSQHQIEIMDLSRMSNHSSRESVCSLRQRRPPREIEERKSSTLPRDTTTSYPHQVDIIEESVTISRRRRSITAVPNNLDPGLKMEDEEGEIFNNTYLADLKEGRCFESGRDSICSSSNRLSELQYRNSMCPPHLKSSYPAETQVISPGQCKEDDIKIGTVDLDDSMSSSLLPGEKPRTKKDWGQTLYKKPGPPTPSKNGGRLSLQGNEVHPREVLREQNTGRTPSRIKALFSRSASRDTENASSSTPRGHTKRRSIFRR